MKNVKNIIGSTILLEFCPLSN